MKKKTLCGYFTIEATCIISIVVCVLALLCYLGMYMCNRCMLLQDAYLFGVKGSTFVGESNADTVSYMLKQSDDMLSKYYGISQIDKNMEAGLFEIVVELQCEMRVPFAFFSWEEEKMNGVWKLEERKSLDRTNPVDFIRACRKVEKVF